MGQAASFSVHTGTARLFSHNMLYSTGRYNVQETYGNVALHKIMNIRKKLNNRLGEKLNVDTPTFCFFKNFV